MKLKKSQNENKNQSPSNSTGSSTILKICNEVAQIYSWLDENIKTLDSQCLACGKCCNFDSFGHKLFITTPELLYFLKNVRPIRKTCPPKPRRRRMLGQSCPYLEDGKCTVRDFRFAGCRIFFCKSDTEKQNQLSETAVGKFKSLCDKFNFPYCYADSITALNSPELAKLV
jgi:hypothetical protein